MIKLDVKKKCIKNKLDLIRINRGNEIEKVDFKHDAHSIFRNIVGGV